MCSIIGSFDLKVVEELALLNLYRGQHSHSIACINQYTGSLDYLHRDFGPLNLSIIDECYRYEHYYICHQQAPTTSNKDRGSIHPASYQESLLWHNGIIKDYYVKKMKEDLKSDSTWDTMLILQKLSRDNNLDNIDGTFSCVEYHDSQIYLFRNEISPLFIDKYCNISSTKFNGCESVEPNKVWNFNLKSLSLDYIFSFNTFENPYYFGE